MRLLERLLGLWMVACLMGCSSSDRGTKVASTLGHTCAATRECAGGEFCDRGVCAQVDTQVYGHGYGAQCFPEGAYQGGGLATHCRRWSCESGHCSSCAEDSECPSGTTCVVQQGAPGKTCAAQVLDLSADRETQKGEIPDPVWQPNLATECQVASDCLGDQFCDRGSCVDIAVDQHGHGYGCACRLTAPFNINSVCANYLCVHGYCSSCLADSECDVSVPHCIRSPYWPEGRVCDTHDQAYYYDERGCLREEFWKMYGARRAELQRQIAWRAEAGLPVREFLPPAEEACLGATLSRR